MEPSSSASGSATIRAIVSSSTLGWCDLMYRVVFFLRFFFFNCKMAVRYKRRLERLAWATTVCWVQASRLQCDSNTRTARRHASNCSMWPFRACDQTPRCASRRHATPPRHPTSLCRSQSTPPRPLSAPWAWPVLCCSAPHLALVSTRSRCAHWRLAKTAISSTPRRPRHPLHCDPLPS